MGHESWRRIIRKLLGDRRRWPTAIMPQLDPGGGQSILNVILCPESSTTDLVFSPFPAWIFHKCFFAAIKQPSDTFNLPRSLSSCHWVGRCPRCYRYQPLCPHWYFPGINHHRRCPVVKTHTLPTCFYFTRAILVTARYPGYQDPGFRRRLHLSWNISILRDGRPERIM